MRLVLSVLAVLATLALITAACGGPSAPEDVPNAGASGVGDTLYPGYGNGGYDVANYLLALDWDDDERTIDGLATITLTATQELARFNLDLVGLDVTAIEVDGQDATFERYGRELVITPAAPLSLGDEATVTVAYNGRPTLLTSEGEEESTGWIDLDDHVVAAGQPEGSAGWYPVNEHPTDKATYRFEITADADLVVAANGSQVSVSDAGDKLTWVYETEHPQASYLTTVAIGDFVPHTGAPSASGVPVRHFFHANVFDDSVTTMQRTGQMIDLFEEMFGPYPFENYGSIVVDADLFFALETQTLSVFSGDLVDADASYEDIVAHEVVHQWFGNHVSLGQWNDVWLNEGIATYGQYLWFEAIEPGYDIDAAMRNAYEQQASLVDSPPAVRTPTELLHPSVYIRGAFTLHALRTTIGDDQFFELLATYVERFAGKSVTTPDFTSLAEEISGQDLDAFFDAWLYSAELPELP